MKKLVFVLFFFCFQNGALFAQNKEITPSKPIIVYGSNQCHHCLETKEFLTKKNIAFIFFDIDTDSVALHEMLKKVKTAGMSTSNLGIPVIDKNGTLFSNNGVFEDFLKKLE